MRCTTSSSTPLTSTASRSSSTATRAPLGAVLVYAALRNGALGTSAPDGALTSVAALPAVVPTALLPSVATWMLPRPRRVPKPTADAALEVTPWTTSTPTPQSCGSGSTASGVSSPGCFPSPDAQHPLRLRSLRPWRTSCALESPPEDFVHYAGPRSVWRTSSLAASAKAPLRLDDLVTSGSLGSAVPIDEPSEVQAWRPVWSTLPAPPPPRSAAREELARVVKALVDVDMDVAAESSVAAEPAGGAVAPAADWRSSRAEVAAEPGRPQRLPSSMLKQVPGLRSHCAWRERLHGVVHRCDSAGKHHGRGYGFIHSSQGTTLSGHGYIFFNTRNFMDGCGLPRPGLRVTFRLMLPNAGSADKRAFAAEVKPMDWAER